MTNQVNTLTNQDVMLDLYKIYAYIPYDAAGNPLTPFGNFCEGYQAATQASESEINSLKERVAELESELFVLQQLRKNQATLGLELTTSNNKLREALESAIECTDDYNMIDRMAGKQYFKHEIFKHEIKLLEELRATPTQSLAEHDNKVIERIATALENADGEFKTLPEYVALVRKMKHE